MPRKPIRTALCLFVVGGAAACDSSPSPFNPFTDLEPLEFNGELQTITSEISPLGRHESGQVLEITILSDMVQGAYILKLDDERDTAGVIIDGGPVNEPFLHRVSEEENLEELFLFLLAPVGTPASAVLNFGPADFRRPTGQTVVVTFDDDFLFQGLFDPGSNTDDDADFLRSIEPLVRSDVVSRLQEIYEGTGVTIAGPDQSVGPGESEIHFSGCRVLGEASDSFGLQRDCNEDADCDDGADCTLDFCNPPTRTCVHTRVNCPSDFQGVCDSQFLFGQVLPAGQDLADCQEAVEVPGGRVDAGNRITDDVGIVYVGGFRGTAGCNPGFPINSTNNIVNALAQSAAHEVGHLLGLNHTALAGLMTSSVSIIFQRELSFQRSQIAVKFGIRTEAFTRVIQVPDVYFTSIFSP